MRIGHQCQGFDVLPQEPNALGQAENSIRGWVRPWPEAEGEAEHPQAR